MVQAAISFLSVLARQAQGSRTKLNRSGVFGPRKGDGSGMVEGKAASPALSLPSVERLHAFAWQEVSVFRADDRQGHVVGDGGHDGLRLPFLLNKKGTMRVTRSQALGFRS